MKTLRLFLLLLSAGPLSYAQTDSILPFREVPPAPDSFTATGVAARMIDGLGFRFYWATEGLRAEDLSFRPSKEARSTEETIDHIMGLSSVILNALLHQPNVRSDEETSPLTFEIKRRKTLGYLQQSSDLLRATPDLRECNIIFQRGETQTELPFWNLLNGPVADALWHVGQVVSFRRSSGNPISSKVSFLQGKVRE